MKFENPLVKQKTAESNVGIFLLSKYALSHELRSNLFKIKKIRGLYLYRFFNIIFHKDKYINNCMDKLIDLLFSQVKNKKFII